MLSRGAWNSSRIRSLRTLRGEVPGAALGVPKTGESLSHSVTHADNTVSTAVPFGILLMRAPRSSGAWLRAAATNPARPPTSTTVRVAAAGSGEDGTERESNAVTAC